MQITSLATPNRLAALAAGFFGIMTIISGGSVLFGPASVQESAGNVVPFVLWFNVLAGFAYVVAAIAIWRSSPRAVSLAWAIALATALAAIGFAVVAMTGAAVEPRTAGALAFRTFFWAGVAVWLMRRSRA